MIIGKPKKFMDYHCPCCKNDLSIAKIKNADDNSFIGYQVGCEKCRTFTYLPDTQIFFVSMNNFFYYSYIFTIAAKLIDISKGFSHEK